MKNITVRTIKLVPINEDGSINVEAYSFISDSTYAQYQALNRATSFMISTYYKYKQEISSKEFQDEVKNFKFNKNNPMFSDIDFGIGVDTLSAVGRKVKSDFSIALKNGLAKGERSANNYKRGTALMTRGRNLRMYDEDGDIYIKWVNKIRFKIITGRKDKDYVELQHTLTKIISGDYKLGQSEIYINDKFLMIRLNIDMGEIKQKEAIKDRVMGIDLGINIPAYCAMCDATYIRKSFGSKEEFFKQRNQFSSRRKRLQKQLALVKGGKGRKDKLSALSALKEKERKWVKAYNHQLSKKIVEFAVKNNVAQINMEKLTRDGVDDRLLGKWSYYELQNMIQYKAQREGIVVRYVDPAYTSQTCSKCGHVSKENRQTQDKFECVKCGYKLNADHNASINIARSTNYVDEDKQEEVD